MQHQIISVDQYDAKIRVKYYLCNLLLQWVLQCNHLTIKETNKQQLMTIQHAITMIRQFSVFLSCHVNSLRPSDAYVSVIKAIIWISAALLLMAPLGTNSVKFCSKYDSFRTRKFIWKCPLQNGSHFSRPHCFNWNNYLKMLLFLQR